MSTCSGDYGILIVEIIAYNRGTLRIITYTIQEIIGQGNSLEDLNLNLNKR